MCSLLNNAVYTHPNAPLPIRLMMQMLFSYKNMLLQIIMQLFSLQITYTVNAFLVVSAAL